MSDWKRNLIGYCKPWSEGGNGESDLADDIRAALSEIERLTVLAEAQAMEKVRDYCREHIGEVDPYCCRELLEEIAAIVTARSEEGRG